jgi:parvulin-like peptidyl-prolyl isomerase
VLAGALLLAGCSADGGDEPETGGSETAAAADVPDATFDLSGIDVAASFEVGQVTGAELAELVDAQRAQLLAGLEGEELVAAEAELVRGLLTQEIQVALVRAYATSEYGLEVTSEEVDAAFAETVEGAGGEEAFAEFLAAQGLTEQGARERIELETLLVELQVVLAEEAGLTDAAVSDEFDARFAAGQYTESEVRHILLDTEQDALDALERVDGGEDFSEVAAEVSTGPSGPNGGELGSAPRGAYVGPFEEAVWADDTVIGDVLGPVETEFGFHLIVVDDRVERSFADVEEELRAELAATASSTAFDAVISAAIDAVEITVDPAIGVWDAELRQVVASDG